jgi:hypothetical protein
MPLFPMRFLTTGCRFLEGASVIGQTAGEGLIGYPMPDFHIFPPKG